MAFWTQPWIQNHGLELKKKKCNLHKQLESRMGEEIGEKLTMKLQLPGVTQKSKERKMRMMVPPWGTPQTTGESLSQLEMHGKLCHEQEKIEENKK